MIRGWILRLAFGLALGLPLMLVTSALARANPLPQSDQQAPLNCRACHSAIVDTWEMGSHGQAAANPEFNRAWQEQGSPNECLTCHKTGYDAATDTWVADGVACEACHSPIAANHPEAPMPTDRSASLCGNCHTETLFEWQVSQHRAKDLSCVGCHDPHAADLKAGNASELCASCHRGRASNFAHTKHFEVGLTCADCHLARLDATGEGHAARDHSFDVKLSTCNTCHAYQMHDPVTVHSDRSTPEPPDALAAVEMQGIRVEPEAASPFGFAGVAGLVGLGIGIVLAPWLERWYRRMNREEREQ